MNGKRKKKLHTEFKYRKWIGLLLLISFVISFGLIGCGTTQTGTQTPATQESPQTTPQTDNNQATQQNQQGEKTQTVDIQKDGTYTAKQDVADYLHLYGKLPSNFITKKEAQNLGWDSEKGNLHKVAPGKSIGGDKFGNREGLLPKKDGRQYYECDINYTKGYRGAERIIYSNDGLIYFTDDHYKTFTQLY